MEGIKPAWSWSLSPEAPPLTPSALLEAVTWDRALGGSTGRGVRVAIIDSGIDSGHPEVGGAVRGWIEPVADDQGTVSYRTEPHEDLFGHGTACAGIIHRIAPEAELFSVRVLGWSLSGKAAIFAAGLRWAVENGMDVVNLSLGTSKQEFFALFHELVDAAYYRGTVLVTAANNMPVVSFPSLYGVVISVACYQGVQGDDPREFYSNPSPPVEFGAPGIDLRLAWANGGYLTGTGNSFAAPHLTGVVALLRSKHPGLTPFEVKTVLRALARNAATPSVPRGAGPASARPAGSGAG
ncbi:MAG: S8 family serine peptidase [Candidatus Rokuibacteriota bacterium]